MPRVQRAMHVCVHDNGIGDVMHLVLSQWPVRC